jgi:hypothetical protein
MNPRERNSIMTAIRTTTALLAGAALAAAMLGGCKNREAESPATPAANSTRTGTTPDTGGTGTAPAMPPANNATPATPPPADTTTTPPPSSGTSGTEGATGQSPPPPIVTPDRTDSNSNSTRDRRPTY